MKELILKEIESKIYIIRGQKVMLDSDLAELYGVSTGRLNEQVQRNRQRFPDDFMFHLSKNEYDLLISQNAISKPSRGGRTKMPFVFTENGVAMLSAVLRSPRAISMNIAIMRIFTKLRSFLALEKDLTNRMDNFEHDTTSMFKVVFQKLDELDKTVPPQPANRKKIGIKPK